MTEPDAHDQDFEFNLDAGEPLERHVDRLPIDREYACAICGYDLRGLSVEAICPECGAYISDAKKNGREVSTWRSRLASTIQQEAGSLFLLMVLAAMTLLLRSTGVVWVLLPVWILALLISLADLADLTEEMPGEAGLRKRFAHIRYRSVVANMNVWLPLLLAATIGTLWYLGQASIGWLIWSIALAVAIRMLLIGVYLEETLRMLHFRRLAAATGLGYTAAALLHVFPMLLALSPAIAPPTTREVAIIVTTVVCAAVSCIIAITAAVNVLTTDGDAYALWIRQLINWLHRVNIFREPPSLDTDEAIEQAKQASSIQAAVKNRLRTRELREDVFCMECGYNLRSLMTDANCPECGRPVFETLSSDAPSVRDWRNTMSEAAREEGMPVVVTLAAMLPALIFPVWFAMLGGVAVWLCGVALAIFTIWKSVTPHPGNRDASEWLKTRTYFFHTSPIVAIFCLLSFFAVFVSGAPPAQRIGIAIAAIIGARIIAVGWWHAHLIRMIDPFMSPLAGKLRVSTLLVAAAQVLFILFITDPGRIWTCTLAILIAMLAGWSLYLYGEAGEALEPPARVLHDDYR